MRFAAFAVLLGIAGYAVTQYVTSSSGPPRCVIRADGEDAEDYEIEPQQASNAATITAVASQRKLPERAVTIALATAMQESALRNIEHGDRDSVGLFQQRPSQGWGTEAQILDPVYATGKFYDHLVEIPGYSRLPLTVAAQRVQRSGFPQAYAKHEANASLLTAALTGRRGAAFTCTTGQEGQPVKAGDPAKVRERLEREFGSDVLASGDGDGTALGTGGGSGRRSKPTAEVLLPAQPQQRGWELAHWSVAHASELGIAEVSYRNRVWSSARSEEGWRTTEDGGSGNTVSIRLSTGNEER
nr:hypothetical protein [Streptomyces sp. HNM0574]